MVSGTAGLAPRAGALGRTEYYAARRRWFGGRALLRR